MTGLEVIVVMTTVAIVANTFMLYLNSKTIMKVIGEND